jgi:hypothetical protein
MFVRQYLKMRFNFNIILFLIFLGWIISTDFFCQASNDLFYHCLRYLKNFTNLREFLTITFHDFHNAFTIVMLALPVFLVFILRHHKWTGFILGIISFALPLRMDGLLECLTLNQYCPPENFESTTDCIFIFFGIIYSFSITIICMSIQKSKHN